MNQTWRCQLSALDFSQIKNKLLPILALDELDRLAQITAELRRRQYLGARYLLRYALSQHYALPFAHWQLTEQRQAAPSLKNPPEQALQIGISHSGDWVFISISESAVGIDVEKIKPRQDLSLIAKKVFTKQQQAEIALLKPTQQYVHFYKLWTLKEALYKIAKPSEKRLYLYDNASWEIKPYFHLSSETEGYAYSLISEQDSALFVHYALGKNNQIKHISF